MRCQQFPVLTGSEILHIVRTDLSQGVSGMSCVVALATENSLYMGGDSASVSGSNIHLRKDPKVFKVDGTNGEVWMFGYVGSFRMGQLVHYSLELPALEEADRYDLFEFLVMKFIPLLRRCLKEGGCLARDDEGREKGMQLIVGLRGNIFIVDYDFQVQELLEPYAVLGVAQDFALGALYASLRMKNPEKRVLLALETAQEFNNCVREPFIVIKTTFDKN